METHSVMMHNYNKDHLLKKRIDELLEPKMEHFEEDTEDSIKKQICEICFVKFK